MAVMSAEVQKLFKEVKDVVFSTASLDAQPNTCIVAMKAVIDDETVYLSDQFFNAASHLSGSLVCKGYGQDAVRVDALFYHVSHAVRHGRRFA